MKRRTFLERSALIAMMLALGIMPKEVEATETETLQRTLVNIFLDGAPDFRHLLAPVFSDDTTSYAYTYWTNRASVFNIDSNDLELLQTYYALNYEEVTLSSQTFAILKKASWLKDEIEAGNVALVHNVIGSTSRNHVLSGMVAESGNPSIKQTQGHNHSGWGGRLSSYLNTNTISFSRVTRVFAKGANEINPNIANYSNILNVNDSRNMGLYHYDTDADIAIDSSNWKWDSKAIMSRSLQSYYASKRAQISDTSIYKPIFNHEQKLRDFGKLINTRLDTIPQPDSFNILSDSYSGKWNEVNMWRQLSGLYDMYHCSDLINMRVASLDYTGWDSHKNQIEQIEPKFEFLFGQDQGLDTLNTALKSNLPSAQENSVFVLYGEFGRQLKGNGDKGTDHGRGNTVLVIGEGVKGGIYGEMFPLAELGDDEKHSYGATSGDIAPKTAMNTLFAEIVNWVADDNTTAKHIFNADSYDLIEDGVDLSKIWKV